MYKCNLYKLLRYTVSIVFILFLLPMMGACDIRESKSVISVSGQSTFVEKEPPLDINKVSIVENKTVYEFDDNYSVVTMYLTVRRGSKGENTDHSWDEINSYSSYYYEDLGIDKYQVEGILQVGNENGPAVGELGYGVTVPNATVQIRGATTSTMPQKSYKIRLMDDRGEWRGQRTIALNKHIFDSTRFRNKLAYDYIKQISGMIGLRTQFVHLYVKDETKDNVKNAKFVDYGLFTQVEQPNKRFLKSHGLDQFGHLYKANFFEFERYPDAIKLKTDPGYDEVKFGEYIEVKGNDDHSKLISMIEDVNDYSLSIEEIFEKWFDEENYFTWLAFNILTGNVDTQNRNFYLYSPLNSNKWFFVAWDCDAMLYLHESLIRTDGKQSDRGFEEGISNYWGVVLHKRVLTNANYRQKLDDKIEELRKIITPEKTAEMITNYRKVVEKYALFMPDIMHLGVTKSQFNAICNAMPGEIEDNYNLYKENLKKPMPFYLYDVVKSENGNKLKFEWGVAYDFDVQNINYTFELARDPFFKDVIFKKENLLLPSIEVDMQRTGKYFFRVAAYNEDGEKQFAFDYYVMDNVKYYGTKCFYIRPGNEVVMDEIPKEGQ